MFINVKRRFYQNHTFHRLIHYSSPPSMLLSCITNLVPSVSVFDNTLSINQLNYFFIIQVLRKLQYYSIMGPQIENGPNNYVNLDYIFQICYLLRSSRV